MRLQTWMMLASVLAAPCAALAQAPPPAATQSSTPPDVQDPREAMPERPTVATHAHTVAPGYLEIEAGFNQQSVDPDHLVGTISTLFKIGVGSRVQLDLAPGWVRLGSGGEAHAGLTDFVAGAKWRLLDAAPVLGAFAMQGTVKFPTAATADGIGTGTTDVNILVISSHEFGPVAIDVNAGYTRRSGDGSVVPSSGAMWTVSSGITISGPVSWAAEVFGYPAVAGSTNVVGFLTGPTFTFGKSVVVDAGAIFNVTGFGGTAAYVGVSWNIGRMWGPPPAAAWTSR